MEFYVGEIRTTFACPGNGYYADTDNNCQLFHVCVTNTMPDGKAVRITPSEQSSFLQGCAGGERERERASRSLPLDLLSG